MHPLLLRNRYLSQHAVVYIRDVRVKAYTQFLDAYLRYGLCCRAICLCQFVRVGVCVSDHRHGCGCTCLQCDFVVNGGGVRCDTRVFG